MSKQHFYNTILFCLSHLVMVDGVASSLIEGAVYRYEDHDRRSITQQLQGQYIWQDIEKKGQGRATLLNIGIQAKQLEFLDLDSFVVREQMQGKTSDEQNTVHFNVEQGVGETRTGGVGGGYTSSLLGDSHFYQLSVSEWFREETLQVGVSIGRSKAAQVPAIVYDTISRRVRLPENITGLSYNLNFLHLTSPKLLFSGDYTFSQRSDRPDAHGVNVLGRYFVTDANGALHLGASYFANATGLKESSLYGVVEAYALHFHWQQRVGDNWVIVPGYRYYREWTAARHHDDTSIMLVTDSPSLLIRYRWGHQRWIEEANEAYVMVQRYNTNEPRTGYLMGIGHKWHF